MAEIDVTQLFYEANGSPMMAGTGGKKAGTLRYFACQALFMNPKQETLDYEEGDRREELRKKIAKEDRPDLLDADLKLIGDLITAMYNVPGIFVPAINMINKAIESGGVNTSNS